MTSWDIVVRWIHVIAATAWFGEVVTINFVLVPMLVRLRGAERTQMLASVFPRLFRLASYLAGTALATGLALFLNKFWGHWHLLWSTPIGLYTLVGACLGTMLAVFHFIVEPRLDGMICVAADNADFELTDKVVRVLRTVPRVGLGVITGAMILMMMGAHGF